MKSIIEINTIQHKIHGVYKVWRDAKTGRYAITKGDEPRPTHCAYASVEAILKLKGLTSTNNL